MEGLTITEMSQMLGLKPSTVKQRLFQKGIKPFCKDALYTNEDLDVIRKAPMGRPPKAKPESDSPES
jgi:hypothetical protein